MSFSLPLASYLQHFYQVAAECPYGFGEKAVYNQQYLGQLPESLFGQFLAAGFRRNGSILYSMLCRHCQRCIPIRLEIEEFQPNRNQRRTLKKNLDLEITMKALTITEEKLTLCGKFIEERYQARAESAIDYYSSFFVGNLNQVMEIEYRHQGRLVGNAVVDLGRQWLNAVYFYFDPAETRRSPGIFNILTMIDLCRQNGINHLYLGYLIRERSSMSYKGNFRPHYLLEDGEWVRN